MAKKKKAAEKPRRIARPVFRRKETYVAIRPIRKSDGEIMKPGETLKGLKIHVLKYLYQRRRIGIKGHPWTELMLEDPKGFPKLMPKNEPKPEPEEPAELQEPVTEETATEETEDMDLGLDDDEDALES